MSLKRFLALVLVFCMVLGMVPAPVYAEETTGEQVSNETPAETTIAVETTVPAEAQVETTAPVEGNSTVATGTIDGGFTWTLDNTGTMTISGTGALILTCYNTPWPAEYVDQVVRAVYEEGITDTGESTFTGHTNLKEVVLPQSVTSIGPRAFYGCTGLTTVDLPDQVTDISTGAFQNCTGLTTLELPDTLEEISLDAFRDCTSLTELTIPASVVAVSPGAFTGCNNLKKVTFLGDAPNFNDYSTSGNLAATFYYPAGNATWTEEAMGYFDTVTWEAYGETQEPETPAAGNALTLGENTVSVPANTDIYFTFTPTEDGDYWIGLYNLASNCRSESGLTSKYHFQYHLRDEEQNVTYLIEGEVYTLTANTTYTFVLNSSVAGEGTVMIRKASNSTTLTVEEAVTAYVGDSPSTASVRVEFETDTVDYVTAVSTNEEVVKVTSYDNRSVSLEVLQVGTATIELSTYGGATATCEVTVYPSYSYALTAGESVVVPSGKSSCYFTLTVEEDGVYWLRAPLDADCYFGQAMSLNTNFDYTTEEYQGRVIELTAGKKCGIYLSCNSGEIGKVELVKTQYAERIDVDQTAVVGWWNGSQGAAIDVTCTLYPAGSVTKALTASSDNPYIANGGSQPYDGVYQIGCRGIGTANITVSTYEGVSVTIPVEVKEPWAAGVSVEPVTMMKDLDTSDWTNAGDGTVYKVYNPETVNPQVTVTYVDDRIVTCAWSELEAQTGLHMDHLNPLFDTSAWKAGSHTWKVMLLDDTNAVQAMCDMTINIVDNPIKSFTVDQVSISEIIHRDIATDENGNNFGYYDPIRQGAPMVTIEFTDGTSLNCEWYNVYNQSGYSINNVNDIYSTSNWVPGNSYTWQVQLEKNGVVYATYDVPVTLNELERYSLTQDAVNTIPLKANQTHVLEYTAAEDGYLLLWTPVGESYSYMAGQIYNSKLEGFGASNYYADGKHGQMITVEAGQSYEIMACCSVDMDWSFTLSFLKKATDIQLETTNVEGYVGQVVIVDFEGIPAGSRTELDFNHVVSQNTAVAEYRGGDQNIWIGLVAEGNTTVTVTYGGNTHIINVTAKNPDYVNVGDVKNVSLEPGKTYAFGFTAAQAGAYYACWDKAVEGITASSTGISDFRESTAGAYDRIRMQVKNDNQDCVVILENTGNETQTFDLYLGEAVELQQDELVITGPAEVKFGAKEVELLLSMPMFADYGWLNWYAENINIYDNDNSHALMNCNSAGTFTITVTTETGITASHTVIVKPYGDGALQSWTCPGDGGTMTMTFTPTESGYYYLSYANNGNASFSRIDIQENSEKPLNEFEHNGNGGSGKAYKLEANKTYTFVAYDVWSTHSFFMTKLDVAPSLTVTPSITGKVHEQKQLQVTYTGACKWSVKSSDESIVMTGGGNKTSQEVFLLGEGTAQLIVTDQDGNTYICNVTVSGELGTEDMEIRNGQNGWDEMGLKAGDSQTYNFTPNTTGMYWINSELGHNLGITVEQNGNIVSPEYQFNKYNGYNKIGAAYRLTAGTTYQITFTSNHNMTTFINAELKGEVNEIYSYEAQIIGNEDDHGYFYFELRDVDIAGYYNDAIGDVSVTSSDENVIKITYVDGGEFRYDLVGGGNAIVTIKANGVEKEISVSSTAAVKVNGISVASVTMIQGTDTSDLTFDNDDHIYKVYNPGVKNPEVHVYYSNGNSVTYHWNDVEQFLGLKMGHANNLATTENWTPGTYTWTVDICDSDNNVLAAYDMTITILENPIASVTAAPATMTEGLDVNTTYDENDNLVPFYDMGMYGQDTELTLTYSNGTVITSTWMDLYFATGCYHVESISSWRDSSTWIPGNSYTWTIAIKDDQGNTYATCDIPVYVEKLDRQTLTLDTAATVSLNAYQHKILEFDASESGYLWLWTAGESFEVVNEILDKNFDRVHGDPHNAGNKYGVYFPVTAGEHYDIYVYSPSEVSNSITATMMTEATDIQLETTEVVGYAGQQIVWVDFTCIPEGSLAQLDYNNVIVGDEQIVLCRTRSDAIGIEMLKAGSTTIDITVGTNTHTINVTVKEPVALKDGDIVKQLTLKPGESYGFSVTPDDDSDYIVAYDKEAQYISASFSGYSIGDVLKTADYNRFKMRDLYQGNTYTCVLKNDGEETQTFDLYLGKVVEPKQGDLTITGPTEVEYGEDIELYIDVPMFVDIPWINWSHDNNDIAGSYDQNSEHYFLHTYGAGTVTVTAGNNDITATHTVTVKPYGEGALDSWTCPGDGNTVTMTFTPAENGWYWLNYNDQEYIYFTSMGPVGTGEQPLAQESYHKGSGSGMIYKLEGGKTYTFEATDVHSSHTFFMHKLDVATSVTMPSSVTGKVHEQKWLSVESNGFCSLEYTTNNENVFMIGGRDSEGAKIFLLGEGTATLTVTDQDGNKYTCQVTVSGELGTENLESDGWAEVGLAADDSQTYNFTAYSTGLYWIHSEHGHNLGIKVEQGGVEIPAEYDYGYGDGNVRRGKVYSFVDGQTYQITFTSDHNMTTAINVGPYFEANDIDCWRTDLEGQEGDTEEIYYDLLYLDPDGRQYQGIGQVTVTSDNEAVAKGISADGKKTVIEYVGEGSTTIHINVNGVSLKDILVTVNPSLKATSFTVENVTLYERLDTSKLDYDDGRTYMVYRVDTANPHVTFKLSNDLSFDGSWDEVRWRFGLRMGHAEVLENTCSWGVGDHKWVVTLSDDNGKILGECEITVTIEALPSTVIPMDQETPVTLGDGEATGLKVTPEKDGYLLLWINDREANFEFMGAMDSAGFRYDNKWIYDNETGRRGYYVAASEGVSYEFFVKANNGAGTANVTPTVIPATTDIILETTEVEGYVGQCVTVKFEKNPGQSIIPEIDCTANTNEAVAWWDGWSQYGDLTFQLTSKGETTITLKMGDKTYAVKVIAKEPPAITLDTPDTGTLTSEEEVVYAFTPAEDGDYIICVNNGINMDCKTDEQFECGTAEYNRKFLGHLVANQTYYIVLTNSGEESQNYELSVGKAVLATGISIVGKNEMIADSGDQQTLELTFTPQFGYLEEMRGWEQYITWESDNYDVVSFNHTDDRSAYVTAQNPGTATITATAPGGLVATFTITVKDYKESVDQWWAGNEGGGELNFSFTPETDGYYHLHWRDLWGPDPVLTADGDQPLFFFEYGWDWSNGFVYQMEAGKTYTFHCDWAGSDTQIYMKKVEMATKYELDAESITGKVHGMSGLGVYADGISYWEMTSSNEDVVMVGPGGYEWKNILFVGEGTAILTVTDHLGNTHECQVTVSGEMPVRGFDGREVIGLKANDSMTYTFTPGESGLFWIGHELEKNLSITLKQAGTEVTGYTFETSREGYTGTVYQLTAGTAYELTVSAGDERVLATLFGDWVIEANQMNVEADQWLDLVAGEKHIINYELHYIDEKEDMSISGVGTVTVTSNNEDVVKVESYDGGRAKLVAVDKGTATVTFKLNGETMHEITVTVTKPLILTLGEKLDVTYPSNGEQACALFTPEKTGYYSIYMDTPVRGFMALMGFWGTDVKPGVNYTSIHMEAGNTYEIISWLSEPVQNATAQLWVTEADYITNLKIVEEPVKKTYFVGSLDSGIDLEGLKLKLTWSDGSTSSYTLKQLMQTNGKVGGYGIELNTKENEDGQTGVVTISCCEGSDTYDVTLVENPVASIEVVGELKIPENTYGESNGDFWFYSPDFVRDALKLKVNYKDGTSVVIPATQTELDGYLIYQDVEYAQNYQPWTKDSTNTIHFQYMGHETSANVQIVDNWIENIEVSGTPTTEFRLGNGKYGFMDGDTYIFNPSYTQLLDGLTFKVTSTEGESKEFTLANLEWIYGEGEGCGWYDGLPVEVYVAGNNYGEYQQAQMVEEPCELTMTVRYGWKTATFTVNVLQKEEIHVHDIEEIEAKAATYEEAGNIHCWFCESCNTIFGDAELKTVLTADDVIIPKLVKVEVQKDELNQQIDEVLNNTTGEEPVKEVVVQVQDNTTGNSVSSVVLPKASVDKIVEANDQAGAEEQVSLTVELNTATVTLDSKALQTITEAAGDSREITLVVEKIAETELTQEQQNAVEEHEVEMVISAELVGTDGVISETFGGGTATVKIPFTPAEGTNGSDYKLLYVADNGETQVIDTTYADGCLVFTLEHFSEYVVVKEEKPVITGEIIDTGRTLSLEGVIYINQYVKVTGFEGVDIEAKGGLLVWDHAVTEAEAVFGTQTDLNAGLIKMGSEYAQRTDGIFARKYADVYYLRVYIQLEDGSYVYGPLKEYSVKKYCENKLSKASTSAELKAMCAAMLHYGAAAQVYSSDYKPYGYANADILSTYPAAVWDAGLLTPVSAVPTGSIAATGDVSDNGKSLSLTGAICVNYYFGTSFASEIKTAELLVWTGVKGALTEENVSYTVELQKTGSEYAAQSRGINTRNYGDTIFACAHFVDAEGNHHYSPISAYSPERYAGNKLNSSKTSDALRAVCERMVIFGECAKAYFTSIGK